jgi:hypothetical protein
MNFFDGEYQAVVSVYCAVMRMLTECAARTRQSLESRRGDPLENGINATIDTLGLEVASYRTSQWTRILK